MNLKEWLKELYKQVILIVIYTLIMIYMIYTGLFENIIFMCMWIIGGIVLACCMICIVVLEEKL